MTYLNTLESSNKTCLIFNKNTMIFESSKRGVQPLIDFMSIYKSKRDSYILVDKIIGRGAVILAKLIGVKEIHTPIISVDALDLANEYKIYCNYKTLVPYINNRDNTGRCPIEKSVLGISDPNDGFLRIQNTLNELKKAT